MARASRGIRVALTSNATTLRRNLFTKNQKALDRMARAVVKAGEIGYQEVQSRVPRDTWWMANHTRLEFTGGSRPANFVLGWYRADWADRPGSTHFYPPYVEAKQPSLRPAARKANAQLKRDFDRIVKSYGK